MLSQQEKSLVDKVREYIPQLTDYTDRLLDLKKIDHNELDAHTVKMKELINAIGAEFTGRKVDNEDYNTFLVLVRRYNWLFLRIDMTKVDPNVSADTPLLGYLAKLPIDIIDHDLVADSCNRLLVATDAGPDESPGFTPHVETRGCCFYDHNQARDDFFVKRGFLGREIKYCFEGATGYYMSIANSGIGGPTLTTNVQGFFISRFEKTSQGRHQFLRPRDRGKHEREKVAFKSAKAKLRTGQPRTEYESHVLKQGEFFCSTGSHVVNTDLPVKSNERSIVAYLGHAFTSHQYLKRFVIVTDFITRATAPVFYEDLGAGAISARMVFAHLMDLSHNHADHLDFPTIDRGMRGYSILIKCPKGDGDKFKKKGYHYVLEYDWNKTYRVEIFKDYGRTQSQGAVLVGGYPSKHASNTGAFDVNKALFCGSWYRLEGSKYIVGISGDTGELNRNTHMAEWKRFVVRKGLLMDKAFLPAGPDRKRSLMDCTHGPSIHILFSLLEYAMINAESIAAERAKQFPNDPSKAVVTLKDLEEGLCISIAYHKDRFRLGPLNFNDPEGSFMRALAILDSFSDKMTIKQLYEKLSKLVQPLSIGDLKMIDEFSKEEFKQLDELAKIDNLLPMMQGLETLPDDHMTTAMDRYAATSRANKPIDSYPLLDCPVFVMMDKFERAKFMQILELHKECACLENASCKWLKEFICKGLQVPVIGEIIDNNKPVQPYKYQFSRLIVNKGNDNAAYETILSGIGQTTINILDESIQKKLSLDLDQQWTVFKNLVSVYLDGNHADKKAFVTKFYGEMKNKPQTREELMHRLSTFTAGMNNWETFEEKQRDEGLCMTIAVVAYGVIADAECRKEFVVDWKKHLKKDVDRVVGSESSSSPSRSPDITR